MTTKQVRWRCQRCNDGLLAPMRPRMNDVRRYCLPCSSETGWLVERIAPTLEKKRTAKKAAVAKRSARKRATAAKKRTVQKSIEKIERHAEQFGQHGMPIQREAERVWRLFEKYHGGKPMPKIRISWRNVNIDAQGTIWFGHTVSGTASEWDWEIMLKPRSSWQTLAHELCHLAVGNKHGHNKVFYRALKEIYEARWKKHMDWSKVTRYGYIVDGIMSSQIQDELKVAWNKKRTEGDQR